MSSERALPRMVRGAIVGLDPVNPLASVTIFQYNPDTLRRTLHARAAGEGARGGNPDEVLRLKGAPEETISLDVEIDATDQLERGDGTTVALGIYPQLSALEMLLYPKSALVIANTILLALGTIEIIPPNAPLTIFVWGPKRALPVKLTDFTINEEAYDASLNPIRAKVSLGLRVLSYSDLPVSNPGYALFLAHQVAKEVMATIGSSGNLADVAGGGLRLA